MIDSVIVGCIYGRYRICVCFLCVFKFGQGINVMIFLPWLLLGFLYSLVQRILQASTKTTETQQKYAETYVRFIVVRNQQQEARSENQWRVFVVRNNNSR